MEDLDTCGLDGCHMAVQSDQEPAIVEIQREIAEVQREIAGTRRRVGTGGTALENSSSNGRFERAIGELGGRVRTIKAGLESRIGTKVKLTHPSVPWIAKHAASVINRFFVLDCGKTSYERIKGRRCIEPIAEFGELVICLAPPRPNARRSTRTPGEYSWYSRRSIPSRPHQVKAS